MADMIEIFLFLYQAYIIRGTIIKTTNGLSNMLIIEKIIKPGYDSFCSKRKLSIANNSPSESICPIPIL